MSWCVDVIVDDCQHFWFWLFGLWAFGKFIIMEQGPVPPKYKNLVVFDGRTTHNWPALFAEVIVLFFVVQKRNWRLVLAQFGSSFWWFHSASCSNELVRLWRFLSKTRGREREKNGFLFVSYRVWRLSNCAAALQTCARHFERREKPRNGRHGAASFLFAQKPGFVVYLLVPSLLKFKNSLEERLLLPTSEMVQQETERCCIFLLSFSVLYGLICANVPSINSLMSE